MIAILQLIRIKDWLKNLIVFFPIIYSGNFSNFDKFYNVFIVFCIFCLTSSIIYILNDIIDKDDDKKDELKKIIKPLAREVITIKLATLIISLLAFLLIILLFNFKIIFIHTVAYIMLNLFYIFILKKIIFLDLLVISFGYVIRVDAGSTIINEQSSLLIILTIFSLSFFAISMKRYIEFNNKIHKKILASYTNNNLKFSTLIGLLSSIFFYFLYILFVNQNLFITFPLVLFFLFRYYFTYKNKNKLSPIDIVLKDIFLLFFALAYFITLLLIMY